MTPELLKYYRVEYISDNEDDSYCGVARCLSVNDVPDDDGVFLSQFRLPNGDPALFDDEDILEEVEAKEFWN